LRNKEILEFTGSKGYFRNTTVQGSITGESLDLGVIDDPIKGREQANSITFRDKAWDWFTDDFFSRFSEDAGFLMILTRWHLDDPAGRMIEKFGDKIKVVTYKAVATENEKHRKEGDPLFPELKSLEFLMERKSTMPTANFEALYQQSPIVAGGEMFKDEWWKWYKSPPLFKYRVMYVDTANKTKERNDYSVFQVWGVADNGIYLIDMLRGKWEAPELLMYAKSFWAKHKTGNSVLRYMGVEDKANGTGLIQTLRRESVIPIRAIQRNIDKVSRANDCTPMIESGRVFLPDDAPFLSDLLAEAAQFPNGSHDDTLDPLMDAIQENLINSSVVDYNALL
jgi:predicted phage terminase large subunit-like protein